MYREIKIGERTIPMSANGATPIRYRMVFGKDLISEFQNVENNYSIAMDTISELAFIMAKAGEKADMDKLNKNAYVAWLEQFEPFDITNVADAIVDVYMGNVQTSSEVKKKARDAVKEN
jgi:hypothetical protein